MGCASHIPIKMEGLQLVSIDSMQNNLSEDSYPGMMIASGNIYSCRYGIDIVRSEAFTPSKAMIFAALIKDNIPEIDLKTVSLILTLYIQTMLIPILHFYILYKKYLV